MLSLEFSKFEIRQRLNLITYGGGEEFIGGIFVERWHNFSLISELFVMVAQSLVTKVGTGGLLYEARDPFALSSASSASHGIIMPALEIRSSSIFTSRMVK